MSTADVISLGGFLLSVVGAIIALRQAGVASAARADAQRARDDAADHETAALQAAQDAADAASRSADEAKRTADALEEANELARTLIPTDRWEYEYVGGVRHSVRNVSGALLIDVTVFAAIERDYDRVRMEGDNPREVLNGESVYFTVLQAMGLRAATVVVSSVDANNERDRWTRSIH